MTSISSWSVRKAEFVFGWYERVFLASLCQHSTDLPVRQFFISVSDSRPSNLDIRLIKFSEMASRQPTTAPRLSTAPSSIKPRQLVRLLSILALVVTCGRAVVLHLLSIQATCLLVMAHLYKRSKYTDTRSHICTHN